ncbi:zinc-binding dehydrogenase [Thermostaphylospora chromogena]|uniref:zinc-binding dehydrogenase n=1 Tax=Thermostaphylospora chromogena TaxID=35622 RepID=UPI000B8395CB|nr:zinc-binding dehydrogenase [Thermostaphylospora chromogena]
MAGRAQLTSHHQGSARTAPSCLARGRPGGRVIILAGLGKRPVLPVGALYTRDASLRGCAISNATVPELAEAATAINHLLARGSLVARIGARLPLAEAARAHRLRESGHRGRIVVVP